MAVGLEPPQHLLPVRGVRLGIAEAAVKKPGRPDLLVMAFDAGTKAAGVFTRNAFCAAPVSLCRIHLRAGDGVRAFVVNSGNANAGTGAVGEGAALATVTAVADALQCHPQSVLPFSTGVIGERLPIERIRAAIPDAIAHLDADGWERAASAIMTTDTVPKAVSRRLMLGGERVTVTGIAKGAGMICPDMATMLAFIATDARLQRPALQKLLERVVADSFNAITVDGDTSTNDSCMLAATGQAGPDLDGTHPDYAALAEAVADVCHWLAQAVVRDAEGATRFIMIDVDEAADRDEARRVAYTLAHSPLFKTAAFAGDPNWGRILAAVGRSGIELLDIRHVNIWLDDVRIVQAGCVDAGYTEEAGAAVMAQPEYTVRIALGRGAAQARLWTCDLSYDYVRINAEYRS